MTKYDIMSEAKQRAIAEINEELLQFAISKMRESSFDDEEALLEFLEHDYKMLGDKDAFLIYYAIGDTVIWVHFMWAIKPRLMYKVLKEFENYVSLKENIILFDCDICDGFNALHKHHAKRIYVWTKELK